jgi:hypothetical protein
LLCVLLSCSAESINAPEKLDESSEFTKAMRRRQDLTKKHLQQFIDCLNLTDDKKFLTPDRKNQTTGITPGKDMALNIQNISISELANSGASLDALTSDDESEKEEVAKEQAGGLKLKRKADEGSGDALNHTGTPQKRKKSSEMFGVTDLLLSGEPERKASTVLVEDESAGHEEPKLWRSARKRSPTKRFIISPTQPGASAKKTRSISNTPSRPRPKKLAGKNIM